MSIIQLLIIQPIASFLEFLYVFLDRLILNKGLTVISLSLVVNILILPLYNAADAIQKKNRDLHRTLLPGIERIKSTFSGDERFLLLSTYYRQNHYHPLYELRGSLGILLQVPFFIAAYQFLSHLTDLRGNGFLAIADLSLPDGMLVIGGVAINLLPILMTLINLVSGFLYTKELAKRDAVQVYILAGLFLLLLYNSPSALVLYWTCNNIFSLGKNIFQRVKRPHLILYLLSVSGVLIGMAVIFSLHPYLSSGKRFVLIGSSLFVVLFPLFLLVAKLVWKHSIEDSLLTTRSLIGIFSLSMAILFLLQGIFIPSSLISSSTNDFSFTGVVTNPIAYVLHTAVFFLGVYGIWIPVMYLLSKPKIKLLLTILSVSVALITLINVLGFQVGSTILSISLHFDDSAVLIPSLVQSVVSLALMLIIPLFVLLLWKKQKQMILVPILLIVTIGTLASSAYQMNQINTEYLIHKTTSGIKQSDSLDILDIEPIYTLSRQGKNVLFIFLDKATNHYLPLILEELPQLKEQLDGFVYYPNTISFGEDTIHGSAAMSGGYEYTPEAMNERNNERLVDKHNEALLVLPKLFLDEGFSVIVTDPPYSNYRGGADFTPFLDYPDIQTKYIGSKFAANYRNDHSDVIGTSSSEESDTIKDRIPLYSIMRTAPPVLRYFLYDKGRYFQTADVQEYSFDSFIGSFSQLFYLRETTKIQDDGNFYNFISNHTPHLPMKLQTPEFEPRSAINNSSIKLDGIPGVREIDRLDYYSNAASLKRIGVWLEYLKAEGVYDNSRIVIVADHGSPIFSPLLQNHGPLRYKYNAFVPLLLFKDFNAKGPIRTDESFMTHADTPVLLAEGIIDNLVNPLTQKPLIDNTKGGHIHLFVGPWNPQDNQGNVFDFRLLHSFTLHNQNIFDKDNWTAFKE